MQYIVLDLEWNQPCSYNSSAYREVGGKLIFEMIQIGAIRLNENREIVGSFNQLVQPTHYIKLHPRIRRITQISQDDLSDAPQFAEAIELFAAWCGSDYSLLTWGCDDISVLYQNMEFFGCGTKLAAIYDIQKLFGDLLGGSKDRKGLSSAMAQLGIEPEENLPFHNALNDAYYTAMVFRRFPNPTEVLNYPQTPRKLIHNDRRKHAGQVTEHNVGRIADALKGKAAQVPNCPVCGRKLPLAAGYVRQDGNQYSALAVCESHGLLMIRLQFAKPENGKRQMTRSIMLSEEQSEAYVHTKILQWQQKLYAQEALKQDAEACL